MICMTVEMVNALLTYSRGNHPIAVKPIVRPGDPVRFAVAFIADDSDPNEEVIKCTFELTWVGGTTGWILL